MKTFTDLEAWKTAMSFCKEVYKLSEHFPSEERYGITSQLRRAAVGVLANIAEGFSRAGAADKAYKYTVARGECSEARALLLIALELHLLKQEELENALCLNDRTGKLLSGLIITFNAT